MIKLHDTLCEDFWADGVLLDDIRSKLLAIAEDFIDTLKITSKPDDITLTGSVANYNYTEHSDVDLHVIYNLANVECDQELTRDYVLAKKSLWNDKHNIFIHGREVEVYVQDANEPHVSSGVYSVLRNTWVHRPTKQDIDVDEEILGKKLHEYVELVKHNLNNNTNLNYLKRLRKKISDMRKESLASGGQYSIGNLIFKDLRNKGYLDKLAKLETQAYDKSMSIESFATFMQKHS